MFLTESESKLILKEYGITIPPGLVVSDINYMERAVAGLNGPVAIKALVGSGGRGKKNGIRFADNPAEAVQEGSLLLGKELAGQEVTAVLVEEKIAIQQELYLGITIDFAESKPLILFCTAGGVEIEETEGVINKYYFDLLKPVQFNSLVDFVSNTDLQECYVKKVAEIIDRLITIFCDYDALTVEINPLAITSKEEIIAVDAKIVTDDAACFRQKSLEGSRDRRDLHPLEKEAEEAGLSLVLVSGGGEIGLICGGAGLGMATMDIIAHYGGKTANFLDTGGGLSAEKMARALQIVSQVPEIKGILVNVFGGINNCLNVAKGIAEVIGEEKSNSLKIPIAVKMQGHFQEEGWALLEQYPSVVVIKEGCIDDAAEILLSLIRT